MEWYRCSEARAVFFRHIFSIWASSADKAGKMRIPISFILFLFSALLASTIRTSQSLLKVTMTFFGVGRSLSNLPRRCSRSIFTSTPISVITSSFSFARSAFSSLFLVRSSGRPRTRKLDLTLWWVLGALSGPVLLGMALICGSSRSSMIFVTTPSIRVSHFSTTLLTLSSIDFSIVRSRLSSLQFNF